MHRKHVILILAASLLFALSLAAQTAVLVPVQITAPVSGLQPVRGSDGKLFTFYELTFTNMDASNRAITIERLDIIDPAHPDAPFVSYSGKDLEALLFRPGLAEHANPRVFAAGTSGLLWMDVFFPDEAKAPLKLMHRFALSMEKVSGQQTIECCTLPVAHQPPITIPPPFASGTWFAANGPSNTSKHRQARIPVNGKFYIGQRYAIDWISLGPDHQIAKGDGKKNEDYYCFGTEELSIADAVVVETRDGIPENPPGGRAVPINFDTVDGNFVVLDLGHGLYAGYAHMQPGSLRVKKGDHVKIGQVLGLLGNTGNSDAPHLHFQLMTSPSLLESEGVPYILSQFTLDGSASFTNDTSFKLDFRPEAQPSKQRYELPIENAVVTFP